MERMTFPTLYKRASSGALQEWTIEAYGKPERGIIKTRWGQVGGAIQETLDEIKDGKNVGRSNETSPLQQAMSEAQSKWELKKKKNGYVEDKSSAMKGEVDKVIEGGIFPMLAQSFEKHGDKIKYPAFAQPKLDGHRCIGTIEDGSPSMWSRTRKPIKSLPHIVDVLMNIDSATLDGELYNHDYREKFEELTSFIRQQSEPKPGHEVVEYHIYDLAMEGTFEGRLDALNELFLAIGEDGPLKMVETIKVRDEDALMEAFEHFTKQGYEGAMVRNAEGLYVNKRSYDLQKVKEFADSEFKVVGVEEGRGKLAGKAIFVCEMDGGQTFSAKMMGKLDDLEKYVKKPKLAIGKRLTVKYQGLTKNGLPRFPVAVRFREDL